MKKIKIVSLLLAAAMMMALFGGCKKANEDGSAKKENETGVTENAKKEEETSEETEKNSDEGFNNRMENSENTAQKEPEEEKKVYTPTFMYFISNSDADFEKTNEVIEKLKKEYGEKVVFDIRNVDEDPSQLDNFPVEGQTPALIMLNTNNDISNFLFQNGNYDELKAAIDAALK